MTSTPDRPATTTHAIAVFALDGVYGLAGGGDVVLLDDRVGSAVAHATQGTQAYVSELEREHALGIFFASIMHPSGSSAPPEVRFQSALQQVRKGAAISRQFTEVVVVVHASDELAAASGQRTVIDIGDFGVTLNYFDAAGLDRRLDRARDAALAGLAMVLAGDVTAAAREIGRTHYAEDVATGRRIYSLEPRGSFSHTSSVALSPDQASRATGAAHHLLAAPSLLGVAELMQAALDGRSSVLQRFIAGFAALELLVESGLPLVGANVPPAARLQMRFEVLARSLDPDGADGDAVRFKELRRQRNAYYHRLEGEARDLDHDSTVRLVRKYLMLLLDRAIAAADQSS